MAARLNQLFRTAPRQYLERTVLFLSSLCEWEYQPLLRTRIVNFFDLDPVGIHSRMIVLSGLHCYTDTPLSGYFLPPGGTVTLPTADGPHVFLFVRDFLNSAIHLSREGDEVIRLYHEEGISRSSMEHGFSHAANISQSIPFYEMIDENSLTPLRASALFYKPQGRPWRLMVQQIAGPEGCEVVLALREKDLDY